MIQGLADLFGITLQQAQMVFPLIVIHIILVIIALIDLIKNWNQRAFNFIWLLLIVIISFFGPVLYFVIGRKIGNDTNKR
jgi:hypothetical protein